MPAPSPVAYPLGAPTVVGNTISVDTALNQPTRITRRIADLTLQKFIVDQIFADGGTVAGGAVIYDQATANELYTTRDVERVAPGAEFPIVGGSRQQPKVAEVEKRGGKFFITAEARRRNDQLLFDNLTTQLANTIVRKNNVRAITELESAITGLGGAATYVGTNWNAVVTAGVNSSTANAYPAADFAKAQLLADTDELGVTYDLWLVNPAQYYALRVIYGDRLELILQSFGISVFASNRVVAGTAYAVARGQVGGISYEQGLTTETWYEAETQRFWVQSSVSPVMYVTNPYSVKRVTGLAG